MGPRGGGASKARRVHRDANTRGSACQLHRSFPSRRIAHVATIGVLAVAFTSLVGVTPATAATLNVSPAGTDNGCADQTFTTISSHDRLRRQR